MSLTWPTRLAWFATALAFCVIVFGAFVRLSNAGLSCPDWPTCYGHITWPGQSQEISQANIAFPERPVETTKAWREQGHRFLAGGLILTTFALAFVMQRRRRELGSVAWVPVGAAVFILFQALLGMWTVTWKLKPIIVMAHLLGGFTTLALLAYTALYLSHKVSPSPLLKNSLKNETTLHPYSKKHSRRLRTVVIIGIILLTIQIALGGWTSANYAALSCGIDFPKCLDQWWPATDFHQGFILWRGIGVNYEGGVLDGAARTAIQLTHRIGAAIVFIYLLATAWLAWHRRQHTLGSVLGLLLITQIALGIGNVRLGLPLPIATAHNGVAALLLLVLLALLVRLRLALPES